MGLENLDAGEFGVLVNLFDKNKGRDRNTGALFPIDDATDLRRGARVIPQEVTEFRRSGQRIKFFQPNRSDESTWYWQKTDGTKIEHGVWQ